MNLNLLSSISLTVSQVYKGAQHPKTMEALKNKRSEEWKKKIVRYEEYLKTETGKTRPPKRNEPGWKGLGEWLFSVRQRGKEGGLSETQLEDLENLGIHFDRRTQKWEENFMAFLQWKEDRKASGLPEPYSPEELRNNDILYNWQSSQNQALINPKYKNTDRWQERKEKLRNAGFVFQEAVETGQRKPITPFTERIQQILDFTEKHPDLPLPENLQIWVKKQRQNIKEGKIKLKSSAKQNSITVDEIQQLHNLGIPFAGNTAYKESAEVISKYMKKKTVALSSIVETSKIMFPTEVLRNKNAMEVIQQCEIVIKNIKEVIYPHIKKETMLKHLDDFGIKKSEWKGFTPSSDLLRI